MVMAEEKLVKKKGPCIAPSFEARCSDPTVNRV